MIKIDPCISRGFFTDTFSYFASRDLHHFGVYHIFHAPMSFFDTTVRSLLRISAYDVELIIAHGTYHWSFWKGHR